MIALANPVLEIKPETKLMDQAGFERLMMRAKISKAISGKHPSEYESVIKDFIAGY